MTAKQHSDRSASRKNNSPVQMIEILKCAGKINLEVMDLYFFVINFNRIITMVLTFKLLLASSDKQQIFWQLEFMVQNDKSC